ncbi:MAG: 2-oxo acid dehydrogenase subunit E2 [Myxococcales bacterium]|nr:2-oxo acid dehydrogenase subunit E2 [Myxococcales bacterium]
MPLFSRPDGVPVKRPPTLRRFMPYLMPGRNEAVVYLDQTIELDHTLAWLKAHNLGEKAEKLRLYDLILAALVRILTERPHLNRFIVGKRLYKRTDIALSFAVKKQFTDAAKLTTVKLRVAPKTGLIDVTRAVRAAVHTGKDEEDTTSEKEMNVVTALPGPLLAFVMWAQRILDGFNLLPSPMIENDPLYASMFIANLGSVGIDAPYHHLFEYGTVPMFVTIGKIKKAPVVRTHDDGSCEVVPATVVQMRYSYDERIADGFYCSVALERLKSLLEDPELLMAPYADEPVVL